MDHTFAPVYLTVDEREASYIPDTVLAAKNLIFFRRGLRTIIENDFL